MTLWVGGRDVGWGQGECLPIPCEELLVNYTLDAIDPTCIENGINSYFDGDVTGWKCSHGTPHYGGFDNEGDLHFLINDHPDFDCLNDMPRSTTCVTWTTYQSAEGFFQILEKPVKKDPYLTYTVSSNHYKLSTANTPVIINVLLSNVLDEDGPCLPTAGAEGLIGQSRLILNNSTTSTTPVSASNTFASADLLLDFSQIWVLQPRTPNGTYLAVDDVSLKCTTTALTGFTTTMNNLNTCFKATNSPNASSIASYLWCFSDGTTSEEAEPCHSYILPGTYNVCLDIVDVNGCCGRVCSGVTVKGEQPPSCADLTNAIKIGNNPNATITLSSLLGTSIPFTVVNNVKTITNQYFHLNANLLIDDRVKLVGCEWFIESGSQITLNSKLEMDDTRFQSCNNLWRGIVVNKWLIRMKNNCEIRDAENALTLSNGSVIDIRNCKFINNYRGIYAPGTDQKSIIIGNSTGAIIDNEFIFDNVSLFPKYVGQSEWGSQAKYGIYLSKVSQFNVSGGLFKNLRTGIHNSGGGMNIDNVEFKDETNSSILKGILLVAAKKNCLIKDNVFTDLHTSIELLSGSTKYNIEGNTFNNVRSYNPYGIKIRNNSMSSIIISNVNKFNFVSGNMIDVLGNTEYFLVDDNEFTSSGSNAQAMKIDKLAKTGSYFDENRFYYASGLSMTKPTIEIKASKYLDFTNNTFNGLSNSIDKYVFSIYGTTKSVFRDNRIFNLNNGFAAGSSDNNVYCCNIVTGTNGNSFAFGGQSASRIFNNELNVFTFYAAGNAEIGPQPNHGNIWSGSGNKAQMMPGTNAAAEKNQFKVSSIQTGGLPSSILPSIIASDWFKNDGTFTTCATNPECMDIDFYPFPDNPTLTNPPKTLDTLDVDTFPTQDCWALLAMLEDIDNTNFTNEYEEQAYYIDYITLQFWQGLFGADFWFDCKDSLPVIDLALDQWYDAQQSMENLYSMSSSHHSASTVLNTAISNQELEIKNNLNTNIDSPSLVFLAQLDNLKSLHEQLNILHNEINLDRQVKAISLLGSISGLPNRFGFLAHHKTIMATELKIVAYGETSITNLEWDALRAVAYMCPLSVGRAVYDAQGLMRYHDEDITSDIANSCTIVTPRITKSSKVQNLIVYPNPTNGLVTFDIPSDLEEPSVVVKDAVGNIIFTFTGTKSKQALQIDLSKYPNGVYFYVIVDQGSMVNKGKIIVIK